MPWRLCRIGGHLTITIHGSIDITQIIFTDTGTGIDQDDLKKIFDPYYTTKAEGTGLGLMLVEKVIREHGGSIKVLSEKNKGTTVIVTLPSIKGQPRLLTDKTEKSHQDNEKVQ